MENMQIACQPPKLWTRHFLLICLVNLLTFVAFHMLVATFPFFVKSLGGDDALAGLASGMFSISALLARPFVGWSLDNISRRLILMVGIFALAVLAFCYSKVFLLPVILGLRFLHGVAWACAGTGNNTNACDHIPRARFAEGMGYFGVTSTISMAIAPALGLALKDGFGFTTLFYVSASIACCALALSVFVDYRPLPPHQRVPLLHNLKSLLEKSALPASATVFFYIMPYGAINTFIALYARDSGVGNGGLFFSIVAISCAVMRVTGGRVADRYGERPIVYVGNVCMILSMLALVAFGNSIAFFVAALIFGISFGMMPPAMQAMAMRVAQPEHRGAASSTYLCAFDLGIGLGGIISGFLVKYFGYLNMFSLMMIPAVFSLLVYVLWAGKSAAAFKKTAAN